MSAADPRLSRLMRGRSYGYGSALRQMARAVAAALLGGALLAGLTVIPPAFAAAPVKIVALGDSLTAGLGLPRDDGFVPRLQAALAEKGIAAQVENAGVSGDTASGGLARLDWSVPPGTEGVIIELGANDMLRGVDPQVTHAALDGILQRLSQRHIAVLLCGMRAMPNLGPDYARAYERIYPELAVKYGVLLYPFFLAGVGADLTLRQHDGLHPNAVGVKAIVADIFPKVQDLIAQIRN